MRFTTTLPDPRISWSLLRQVYHLLECSCVWDIAPKSTLNFMDAIQSLSIHMIEKLVLIDDLHLEAIGIPVVNESYLDDFWAILNLF